MSVYVCVVFPPFVRPHATSLSTRKRRVQNHGDRAGELEVLDGRAKEKSHRLHTRITVKNHKENER